MNFKLISLPEIGLRVSLPINWRVSYSTSYDFIHLSDGKGVMGVIIFRNYGANFDDESIRVVLSEINCNIPGITLNDLVQGINCSRGDLEIRIRASDLSCAKIIYYFPCNDEVSIDLINKVINSLEISEPAHGIYEEKVRFIEKNYKWNVTLPKTWSIRPYGLFNLGFIAKTGTIITWLTFYPLIDEDYIDDLLKGRYKTILASINVSTLINMSKENRGIRIEFSRNGITYSLYLNLRVYDMVLDTFHTRFVTEIGYIVPKFIERDIIGLINEIFSSFSFGPNFLEDLKKLRKYEHCMFSLGILSRFIGKNLNEIFDKYLEVIDNDVIIALTQEIREMFNK